MTAAAARRLAWITGASKGIGRALTLRMAADCWTIAASARTGAELATLAAEGPPGRIVSFPLDVTDLPATETVWARIGADLGLPDLVVLNAGTHIPVTAADFRVDAIRTVVETNLMATVNGLAQVLPAFIARGGGHIAVVASTAGYRGLPTSAAYGATKAGLINMCEALKPELDHHGVRLSVINPGFVKTPLTDRNPFPMPDLISAEDAAEAIVRGLESGAFEIAFPRRFALKMKLLRILPHRLLFSMTRRMIRP